MRNVPMVFADVGQPRPRVSKFGSNYPWYTEAVALSRIAPRTDAFIWAR